MAGSEFGGQGRRPQVVQPMLPGGLTAAEKIQVLNLTGTEDPRMPTDDQRTWQGLDKLSRFGEPAPSNKTYTNGDTVPE